MPVNIDRLCQTSSNEEPVDPAAAANKTTNDVLFVVLLMSDLRLLVPLRPSCFVNSAASAVDPLWLRGALWSVVRVGSSKIVEHLRSFKYTSRIPSSVGCMPVNMGMPTAMAFTTVSAVAAAI